ncbi:MAG: alpha/beta fold hydrolase [Paucibacter sp.]|nr:alpha/beta fold hydrolase [Roseateles sp.]
MAVQDFELQFEGRCLRGSHWHPEDARASVLLLHGGGCSTSKGLAPLREFFFEHGIASTAFDFIGHGQSEGSLIGSSLTERSAQVDAVIAARRLAPSAMAVIGFSMGGHIAALAARRHGFAALGLVISAAYSAGAAALRFGPDFAATIRQPLSWRDSDAFDAVAAYEGRLQIVSAGADAVVPAEIQQRYFDAASGCASRHHEIVAGSPHHLDQHFERAPQDRTRVYDLLAGLTIGAIIEARSTPSPQTES